MIVLDLEKYMLPCLNKKLFGVECFGCGAQRAFVLVLRGDFQEAFTLFPAIYTTILFFVLLSLTFIDKKRNYYTITYIMAIINAIIMVFSYFYKHFYY
ncbi:hypothetical protein FB1_08450 [Flavobacterium branchiophilum NBRC 15030 = ATCC 35035]|uniref:Uncharacterized protein DUF2752 n=1 Tax=Flavobacterium branchiophilum TaxID=55197 RepID=A0A543G8K0_9FLAO|nr:uncharacterized protein DUF2752 [Flavobacterium branchiophilum]GEM54624.1 hypothetical protein FB1_08450 [Flavobacterium branchiophilum NBRC 15030 = ATCC 35035]